MYIEDFTINNYRKFRENNNTVYFVEPYQIESNDDESQSDYSVLAPSTTLIIGKNNTGKTTIVNALKLICENKQPKASDFNIQYLNELFTKYKSVGITNDILPELRFTLTAKVNNSGSDLMTNLSEFSTINSTDGNLIDVVINIKVIITESVAFIDAVTDIIQYVYTQGLDGREAMEYFYQLLDQKSDYLKLDKETKLFKIEFFNSDKVKAKKFALKDLIHLQEIKANRHLKEGVLRDVFNKIVRFQFDNNKGEQAKLESEIKSINTALTKVIESKSGDISDVLQQVENKANVDLDLKGGVSYDSIVRDLIKYNFSDNDDYIPESQFGLGYINLLNIIGEIIHYVDSYQNGSHNSQINLLFIEEPEAFMHPQMQTFFINRIDNAVKQALVIANKLVTEQENKKTLNCQIAITTHSSHIVNSKIHSSNSFDNINYLTSVNKATAVVKLSDEIVAGTEGLGSKNLKFIKKHIKYKVSELFFSDAVIFVEGATEEALLQYYLEQNDTLKDYYISVFNINGAHGKVYFPLIKALKVPCLVITDIDIKREKCQKGLKHKKTDKDCIVCGHKEANDDTPEIRVKVEYKQVISLTGLVTTNATIKNFNQKPGQKNEQDSGKLDAIDYFTDENLHLVFQKDAIEGFHATSLEEALILTNYDNDILNDVLLQCKKNIYNDIIKNGGATERMNLVSNSYKLQKKLSDSKSNFTNDLLYQCIIHEVSEAPKLPNYIQDGFNWLIKSLAAEATPKTVPEVPTNDA